MANRPRGTRDFTPPEMARRRAAEKALRDVFASFNFGEVQTPAFEELELFTAKSGEGIISELYNFQDKGERDLTLRPELTAPVMRMYFQDHAFDAKPIKWFYHGPCYRYDRPQEGRYREFWQFGCEQIGAGTPLAYAELIALGAKCFEALGLKDIEIRIGNVSVLKRLINTLQLEDRGAAMRLIDKEDFDGFKKLCDDQDIDPGMSQLLLDVMAAPDLATARDLVDGGLEGLEAVFELLESFGVKAKLNLGIARGLDYYTGIVFEMHCKELEAQSQLLGGGGYDLSALFGGQETPTMGFGLGFDRALVALEKQQGLSEPPAGPDVYLAALGGATKTVVELATALRAQGKRVELDLTGRKPDKVAKHADTIGAKRLVVIGDRDLESGEVQIKDLASGDRVKVSIEELADSF